MKLPRLNTSTDSMLFAFSLALLVMLAGYGFTYMDRFSMILSAVLLLVVITSWKKISK